MSLVHFQSASYPSTCLLPAFARTTPSGVSRLVRRSPGSMLRSLPSARFTAQPLPPATPATSFASALSSLTHGLLLTDARAGDSHEGSEDVRPAFSVPARVSAFAGGDRLGEDACAICAGGNLEDWAAPNGSERQPPVSNCTGDALVDA